VVAVAKAKEALSRLGKKDRGVEDSVGFSLSHQIRVEILAALHEGPETPAGLAKIVRRQLSTVTYHIEELLKDGSIEIAKTVKVRGNISQFWYRVVELPEFSDEEIAAMSEEERHALAALIVQAASAEALAALWAGKMVCDPRIVLMWDRMLFDKQGREDRADEQAASWERLKTIAGESANRMAKSGEKGVTYIVTSFGFERARNLAPEPLPSGE
jgi:DNA-binding transcriptional ArsR family regulator